MTEQNHSVEYDHALALARQMLAGSIDFVEAGDIARPGQPGSLRASPTGEPSAPVALSDPSKLSEMTRVSVEEAARLLRERAQALGQSGVGARARVFSVRLRKAQ